MTMITTTDGYTRPNEFLEKGIQLPLPPARNAVYDMEVYALFMRQLRHEPKARPAIRVFNAMRSTAEAMFLDERDVALMLCGLGLRAPKTAFPESFIGYLQRCMSRQYLYSEPMREDLSELLAYWRAPRRAVAIRLPAYAQARAEEALV